MAKATQRWRCDGCGAPNDDDAFRCRICSMARPGALRRQSSGPTPTRVLPPIGGRDAPPARRPPAPPARPARPLGPEEVERRTLIALGAAAATLLVAALSYAVLTSDSGTTDRLRPSDTVGSLLPTTTTRPGPDVPSENRAAVAMLPTLDELGAGWAQPEPVRAGADAFELGPSPSTATCALPVPLVPEAGARVGFAGPRGGAVSGEVKVFADVAGAVADVQAPPFDDALIRCLQRAEVDALAGAGIGGASVDVSQATLDPPGLGEESHAYRLSLSIDAGTTRLEADLEAVTFRTGRTVGALAVSAGYGRTSAALSAALTEAFAGRFVPQ